MTLDEAVARVAGAARGHGRAWGITAGTQEALLRYRRMGAQLVPWGSEFALIDLLQGRSRELDDHANTAGN